MRSLAHRSSIAAREEEEGGRNGKDSLLPSHEKKKLSLPPPQLHEAVPQVVMVEGEAVQKDSIRQPENQNGALHPDTLRPMTPDGEQPRRQPNGILEEFPVIAGAGKAVLNVFQNITQQPYTDKSILAERTAVRWARVITGGSDFNVHCVGSWPWRCVAPAPRELRVSSVALP